MVVTPAIAVAAPASMLAALAGLAWERQQGLVVQLRACLLDALWHSAPLIEGVNVGLDHHLQEARSYPGHLHAHVQPTCHVVPSALTVYASLPPFNGT